MHIFILFWVWSLQFYLHSKQKMLSVSRPAVWFFFFFFWKAFQSLRIDIIQTGNYQLPNQSPSHVGFLASPLEKGSAVSQGCPGCCTGHIRFFLWSSLQTWSLSRRSCWVSMLFFVFLHLLSYPLEHLFSNFDPRAHQNPTRLSQCHGTNNIYAKTVWLAWPLSLSQKNACGFVTIKCMIIWLRSIKPDFKESCGNTKQ